MQVEAYVCIMVLHSVGMYTKLIEGVHPNKANRSVPKTNIEYKTNTKQQHTMQLLIFLKKEQQVKTIYHSKSKCSTEQ